jgi:hypothetical protein
VRGDVFFAPSAGYLILLDSARTALSEDEPEHCSVCLIDQLGGKVIEEQEWSIYPDSIPKLPALGTPTDPTEPEP